MSDYTAPIEDIKFTMREVAGLDSVTSMPGFEEVTPDIVDAVLEEAGKFASGVLGPLNHGGDQEGSKLEGDTVKTPAGFKDAYRQFVAGGWPGMMFSTDWGGMGFPHTVGMAVTEMWDAANTAWSLCPMLTQGAVEVLNHHGTKELQDLYIEKLVSGEWTGTMNLTEPQAGSDVGALRTKAVIEGDHYLITGQKIFITFGDHDYGGNVIHLVLARLPGAPEGTRGISLFIVPKILVDRDGTLGEPNDLRVVSLEHKLGIHASPTAIMSYGDKGGAVGYLIGEENRGMACMFTMMNNARLNVGMLGLGTAVRAYQQARDFAMERVQGGDIAGKLKGMLSIIHHPDVRRMLMSMKASVEAMRGLSYFAAATVDRRCPDLSRLPRPGRDHRQPRPAGRQPPGQAAQGLAQLHRPAARSRVPPGGRDREPNHRRRSLPAVVGSRGLADREPQPVGHRGDPDRQAVSRAGDVRQRRQHRGVAHDRRARRSARAPRSQFDRSWAGAPRGACGRR